MISRYVNCPRSWAPRLSHDHSYKVLPGTYMPHNTELVEIVIRRPAVWFNQPYSSKQVVSGDTMPMLASQRYGGDATAYWRIADMNPQVACPDDLAPGEVVQLPIIEL
jgi:hypothetical protein